MKHLLGNNIWIALLSLVIIAIVISFNLSPSNVYPANDEIPFLSIDNDAYNSTYQKNTWETKNGTIRFKQEPIFSVDTDTMQPSNLVWDGEHNYIISSKDPLLMDELKTHKDEVQIYSEKTDSFAIHRILQPDLFVTVSVSDFGDYTKAIAEFSGYKEDKLTLSPDFESFNNAKILRPLDAIEIESSIHIYLEFVWIPNSSDLRFGLVEGIWNQETLTWKVITDDVGFQEKGKGSNATVCQNKAWFALLDGTIVCVHIPNGKVEIRSDLSEQLFQTTNKPTAPLLYRYNNSLIIHNKYAMDDSSHILLVENNKIQCTIHSSSSTVISSRRNKECMEYTWKNDFTNPNLWIFPIT